MNRDFIQARIAATQEQIIAYEAAIDALVNQGVQQYSFDSGQSRQTVTKLSLPSLQKTLDMLYNRCATLEARLSGHTTVVRPAW